MHDIIDAVFTCIPVTDKWLLWLVISHHKAL